MRRSAALPLLVLPLCAPLPAQAPSGTSGQAPAAITAQAPAARPCIAPEHHQFDFWIGEWEVRDLSGKVVGHNRIEPIACGLQEHWSDVDGGTGTSLNAYNAATKQWHQTWVGGGGGVIQLDGGLVDGRMVLKGRNATARGPVLDRITWSPEGKDAQGRAKVRQLWDQSTDGGKTWTVVFDGMYTRTGKP